MFGIDIKKLIKITHYCKYYTFLISESKIFKIKLSTLMDDKKNIRKIFSKVICVKIVYISQKK